MHKIKFPKSVNLRLTDRHIYDIMSTEIKRGDNTMMNRTVLLNAMIERYNALSFTHNYIYGFFYKGLVYMVETSASLMPMVCKLDKASRGQGYSLRFCPTTAQKNLLMSLGAVVLCSEKFFLEEVANSKYNKGEIFEKMVTEYFGQIWEKDSVPFTEDGDLTVDGVAYQLKFEKATFTNEKTLARM